jgi:hypothetical protein
MRHPELAALQVFRAPRHGDARSPARNVYPVWRGPLSPKESTGAVTQQPLH